VSSGGVGRRQLIVDADSLQVVVNKKNSTASPGNAGTPMKKCKLAATSLPPVTISNYFHIFAGPAGY